MRRDRSVRSVVMIVMNWYAIQTIKGQEEDIKTQAEILLPGIDFRLLYRIGEFKYQGKWVERRLPLYSGYLFVITDDPWDVRNGLRKVFRFCKVVEFDGELIPLKADEQHILETLSDDDGIVEMSKGIECGDRVVVIDGPLKGFESKIVHIDRRKKLASLEISIGDSNGRMVVGLEVVSKA